MHQCHVSSTSLTIKGNGVRAVRQMVWYIYWDTHQVVPVCPVNADMSVVKEDDACRGRTSFITDGNCSLSKYSLTECKFRARLPHLLFILFGALAQKRRRANFVSNIINSVYEAFIRVIWTRLYRLVQVPEFVMESFLTVERSVTPCRFDWLSASGFSNSQREGLPGSQMMTLQRYF